MFKSLLQLLIVFMLSACAGVVKAPHMAGRFYPEKQEELSKKVNELLSAAKQRQIEGRIIAVMSPHASYSYSGHVAAEAYKQLIGRDIKNVILIGESHNYNFGGASIFTKGSFKTPLGLIKVNTKLAESLIDENEEVSFVPEVFDQEYSLEVQLPFLQSVLKDFKIVPILLSNPPDETMNHLIDRIYEILAGDEKAIIVASSDLSHYHDQDTANKMDGILLDAIERLSVKEVENLLISGTCEMCGDSPMLLALNVARRLGANEGVLFKYATSGDVSNDKMSVVGYASMGLIQGKFSNAEKDEMLGIARNAIEEYITKGETININPTSTKLKTTGAAFVTIKKNGYLRGCIGHVQPVMPLHKSIVRNSIEASSNDERFEPMNKDELQDIKVEISIISPLELVINILEIEIGKHGLYLVKGDSHAVFLPNIPVEEGWDLETYLKKLSLKAGLPEDGYQKGSMLYKFTAETIK